MMDLNRYAKLAVMSAAALGMTAVLTIEGAQAYFTTYVSAGGSQVVNLGAETEIHEGLSNMTKHISVENASVVNDCFVRVKVFCGNELAIDYTEADGGQNWYLGDDGYWYYRPILAAGTTTTVLDAKIVLPEGFDKDNFNVVVIQECTPVVYDASGNATADWTTVYSDYQETDGGSGQGAETDGQGADVVGLDEDAGGQGGNAGAGNQGEGADN
jgi:hypothetical protein